MDIVTQHQLHRGYTKTPLGEMTFITDQKALWYLSFTDNPKVETDIQNIILKKSAILHPEETSISQLIQDELHSYFQGNLKKFNTPVHLIGSGFQNMVWQSLLHIPYGRTISYTEQAKMTGNQKAFRAVAKANSQNVLPIIVPCHRVINLSGDLGGYAGGIQRKKWLIEHETQHR